VVAGDVMKIIDPQRAGATRRVADDHGRPDGRGRVADDAWSSIRPFWPAEDWDGRAAGFLTGAQIYLWVANPLFSGFASIGP